MSSHDTIFAQSSGRPPAAIAVVRISGPSAHEALRQLCGDLPEPRLAALRHLKDRDGAALDHALVLRFDAPATATGEDVAELHCHGGRAVIAAVLAELERIDGLRPARAGEFTRRAFENGRLDLTEAEGLADLLEAETESQRRAALALADGALRRQIEDWTRRLVSLSARAEAAIDYVGDEDETGADTSALAAEAEELRQEFTAWLARPRAEALKQGIRVVIAGPPNAGKSSLLNALVEEDKAIVTSIEGTTRDAIEVPVNISGIPFVLVDTAGLRTSNDVVEQIGVARAMTHAASADILLWLGDPGEAPVHKQVIAVHPRVDLSHRQTASNGSIAVSAHTGTGLDRLQDALIERARLLLPTDGEVPLNRRQASAVGDAAEALADHSEDIVILAESLRHARSALDRVTGMAGVENVLDDLFGRFCLGK